jgi:hypothetical protein
MSYVKTTAALAISLASIVVALRIDALAPGTASAEIERFEPVSTLSAPVVRDEVEEVAVTETAETLPVMATETTIHSETVEQREMVEWALSRFGEAGLDLPILTIHAFSDRSGCRGNFGYFAIDAAGNFEVYTCGIDFTVLHELGHAWAAHNLSDQDKDEFLENHAYADEWRTDDWLLSGSEHCANILAWGLMETRVNQTRTRPYDHNSMLEAYEILTGGEPLWIAS